ncbi:MAG: undecaprenyl-diphosphate phosphatase [Nitrospirales bacterium]|nr:undecaprenyl-diphosphate phosphatase [Nitrospira sp.]MDR4502125.1 undecaprenyl-diphosphate phosphatase [Nitrospirales bacterium]
MSYLEAIVLAVLQGLTEFLPVSSSGHLVLAQYWFGHVDETNLLFDIMLHCATVVAILVYFRNDWVTLARGLLNRPSTMMASSVFSGAEWRTVLMVVVASIPTAILGLTIQKIGMEVFSRPDIVGGLLMLTGVVLWVGRGKSHGRGIKEMKIVDAFIIGLVQGIAVLPGISRSGSTIAVGLLLGLDRELIVRFSLLISIPAILGATLLEMLKVMDHLHDPIGPYLVGMGVAAVVGYWSIGVILRLVKQDHFHLFSYYLWPVGMTILLWTYVL